jgi:ribosomal protein S18 acetylase RimI-like enzyme
MQYLDSHMLPGFVALEDKQPVGYVFSVYEDTKAVIGEVFAVPDAVGGEDAARRVEETLLEHLLELLQNSPTVDRIESQQLLHPSESHAGLFRRAGFEVYRRLFMVQSLHNNYAQPVIDLPKGLEMRSWHDDDLAPAARLICEAYHGHPDSLINDQYRTTHGSMRFLNNIVRYSGCGTFSGPASHVIVDRSRREIVALILGSRVSPQSGHVTQICVHPAYRKQGLARMLMSVTAFHFMRLGAIEISLTVTEANRQAIELYRSVGYACGHMFDAAVWQRPGSIS